MLGRLRRRSGVRSKAAPEGFSTTFDLRGILAEIGLSVAAEDGSTVLRVGRTTGLFDLGTVGFLADNRRVRRGAVQPYSASVVLPVPEPAIGTLHLLDQPARALGPSVREPS